MTTPYDGKIGLVYWSGKSVGEHSITELAETIRRWLPRAQIALYVKTSDGDAWQGQFDTKPQMAVNGPDDIARWVDTLANFDLELHAWCVLKGINVPGEAELVIRACNVPGVQSMLLDVEDGPKYFDGGPGDARHLIQRVRVSIPRNFHLGLNFDARGQHPKHIHVQQWLPYVGSLHPMVYHKDFGLSVEQALANAFEVCRTMNKPIYPMLQAYGGVFADDLRRGAAVTVELGGSGVSYFRLGTMGTAEFHALQQVTLPDTPLPSPDPGEPDPGEAVMVHPDGAGYSDGLYNGDPDRVWGTFTDVNGWLVKFKLSANPQQAYANYVPTLPAAGRYAVEVFIPHQYAEAREALYFVRDHVNGQPVERKIALDQSIHYNEWAQLGVFELDPALPEDGRVSVADVTLERPLRRIAFTTIRWRPVTALPTNPDQPTADGFDAPVGTEAERQDSKLWPGHWQDSNGFLNRYFDSAGKVAYHTGADLNLNVPRWNMDRGAPVYAVASGVVTWAGRVGDYWRNIIIVKHDPLPDGAVVYSRSAHVENMQVHAGDRVARGQQICVVGKSGGNSGNYHLHFDISTTAVLQDNPGHWPGPDRDEVAANYVDPLAFIGGRRP
ncbi:MAG: peptidoglycan DD-metalloendopeptidase family protein [Ardenticatenaceae bacterium]|nr:peptidoglycan DD-metalloendopeptidase family protein [Anaerolineales bacterium]MCB8920708.1 peptidoglycan DD-metalloendopeptidase family protein [Ardenticatenaceae bacterium]MCB8989667.1 peptidoglycan DD-metalloendopeptidase family protein [Ardenticatenaceae bacterium]MCB9002874.1 peptidoglycan DD-metalloendopeptidase family protein [Ardenticatenaceae bacterium]